jgi:hypothetical protein
MMMGMLAAGGMDLLVDETRPADRDNPRGYYEYDPVRRVKQDNAWVGAAEGKVVKVVSYLLTSLPDDYVYRVIFMERPLDEVLASQRAMLLRAEKPYKPEDDLLLKGVFEKSLRDVDAWMAERDNVSCLRAGYQRVIAEPRAVAEEVAVFLAEKMDTDAMAATVDAELYRQRGSNG